MENSEIPAKKGRTFMGLTALEEEAIRALIAHVHKGSKTPIADAAKELRIEPHAVRMALYRVRNRYDRAQDFIKIYHSFKQKLGRRAGRKYL